MMGHSERYVVDYERRIWDQGVGMEEEGGLDLLRWTEEQCWIFCCDVYFCGSWFDYEYEGSGHQILGRGSLRNVGIGHGHLDASHLGC
jgi:hypothetical protein